MSKKVEPESDNNGWGDATGRYPLEALLRQHGFRIHARPGGRKESHWFKEGTIYTEAAALRNLDQVEVAKLRNRTY